MKDSLSNNKRIAKNTIYLYMRMIVIMAITLFTSREILRILGVDDFGIYNVVAGVVVLLHFLQTGLTSAFQRYLAYDIGKGDENQLNKTFSMSVNASICIAFVVIILSETIGLWFVYTQLVIPSDRMSAALAVYHFSVFTFVCYILRIPYNSAIVAYERMSFYAYISILESILKLVVVYLLVIMAFDRLHFYALLLLFISIIMLVAYYFYVISQFKSCQYKYVWNKRFFYELISFSGWSMLGGVANMTAQQGGNVLLNMFSGLVANASFGIANQVSQAIYAFSRNFQVAFSPQITKLYAISANKELFKLVFRSSLLSYYLMLVLAVPFIMKADVVLHLWLKEVPRYAVGFCVLMTVYQLIDAFQSPLNTLIYATGKIRNYNIWLSLMILINLPLSYVLLKMDFPAYSVLVLRSVINFLTVVVLVIYLKGLIKFPVSDYFWQVVARVLPVSLLSFGISAALLPFFDDSFIESLFYIVLVSIITTIAVFIFGFSKEDRNIAILYVKKKLL